MKKPPIKYIICVQDLYMSEVIYWWIHHDKPCSLFVQKPNTEGLTAIRVTVESDESALFIMELKDRLGCRIYQQYNKKVISK